MSIHIKDLADFNAKLQEAGDKLVVVDFFATWCGPCKMIAPKLEELAIEYGNTLIVLKVDVDECEDLAIQYNISSMPTFVFIKSGSTLDTFSGANFEKIKDTISKHQ